MRNRTATNIQAFDNLIQTLPDNLKQDVHNGRRFIKTDDEEKEWIEKLKITDFEKISFNLSVIKINFENKTYIAIIGSDIDKTSIDTEVLLDHDVNAGLLTVLVAENILRLSSNVSYYDFFDNILFQHIDTAYCGHDFKEILLYLDRISFFIFPDDSILIQHDIYRILSYLICNNPELITLEFSTQILSFISDLALMGDDAISFEPILNCLLSNNYKHAFLELYRILERLYTVQYMKDMYTSLNIELAFSEFVNSFESLIGWKPKEEDALNKLLVSCEASYVQIIERVKMQIPSKYADRNAAFIYGLRNSIVHFRGSQQDQHFTPSQWIDLLTGMIRIIDYQYNSHSKYL